MLTGLAEFVEAGGAVLLVTHDPQAAEYSHRSLQMVNGAIRQA